jgi:hypothetical protein
MTIHRLALLAGLFLVPLVALAIGHRLTRRGARARGAFWGLVTGHTIAAVAATVMAMSEPAFWGADELWRGAIGYWGMLVLPLLLGMLGWLRARPDDAEQDRRHVADRRGVPPRIDPELAE